MDQSQQGIWVFEQILKKLNTTSKEIKDKNQQFLFILKGDLGVGKTAFVKSFLSNWGYSTEEVQSPTFLKMLEYEVLGWGPVLHLDCYQIESSKNLKKLGLEDRILELQPRALFVEWPEKFFEYLQTHSPLLKKSLDSFLKIEMEWKSLGDFKIQIH